MDFCFACLPEHCQRVKRTNSSQTVSSMHTRVCSMIMYRGHLNSISCAICEPQHFPTVRGIHAIWKWAENRVERQRHQHTNGAQAADHIWHAQTLLLNNSLPRAFRPVELYSRWKTHVYECRRKDGIFCSSKEITELFGPVCVRDRGFDGAAGNIIRSKALHVKPIRFKDQETFLWKLTTHYK